MNLITRNPITHCSVLLFLSLLFFPAYGGQKKNDMRYIYEESKVYHLATDLELIGVNLAFAPLLLPKGIIFAVSRKLPGDIETYYEIWVNTIKEKTNSCYGRTSRKIYSGYSQNTSLEYLKRKHTLLLSEHVTNFLIQHHKN